jgi:hypothetical protein
MSAVTLLVATGDSAEKSRAAANFLGTGEGDQTAINAAIRALPPAGGTVMLAEGTYDIRKVEGQLGGVIIGRSRVTLQGAGAATRLILAPGQNTNVIRIIGEGVGHIVIRDLWVDQNRDHNPADGAEFHGIPHGRFEYCGIKAYRTVPGGPAGTPCHDVTIENCTVLNARRLGIMLEGPGMRVLNNRLGNANSDAVELLLGPGFISGNHIEITGPTHVAVGSDYGNDIVMSRNVVHVKSGGELDIAFRTWADSERHVIAHNVIRVDEGGRLQQAMDVRGFATTLTGNLVAGPAGVARLPLLLTGAAVIATGNHFQNVEIVVDDRTGTGRPVLLRDNLMENSVVIHRQGNLL